MNDYELLRQWIEIRVKRGYVIKTDIDNLVLMCFAYYDSYIEEFDSYSGDSDKEYIEDCIMFLDENNLCEFDYYC